MFNKRFPYQLFNQKQNNYKMVREDEVLFVIVVVAIESVNEHGNKRSFFFGHQLNGVRFSLFVLILLDYFVPIILVTIPPLTSLEVSERVIKRIYKNDFVNSVYYIQLKIANA